MNSKMFVCLCRIVAVVVTAFVISGCTNQKEEYKKAIHSVLDQDAQTGKVDRSSIDSFVYSSKTKALNMKNIDLSKCPPEFQAAYIAHSIAWAKKYDIACEIKMFDEKYNSFSGFFSAFLRGLVFDFGSVKEAEEAYQQILNHDREVSAEINSTWNEVLKVAAKYDVDVSKYK